MFSKYFLVKSDEPDYYGQYQLHRRFYDKPNRRNTNSIDSSLIAFFSPHQEEYSEYEHGIYIAGDNYEEYHEWTSYYTLNYLNKYYYYKFNKEWFGAYLKFTYHLND